MCREMLGQQFYFTPFSDGPRFSEIRRCVECQQTLGFGDGAQAGVEAAAVFAADGDGGQPMVCAVWRKGRLR